MIVNTVLLSHPVNWIKVGLMATTFILAMLFIVQHVTPALPAQLTQGN